MNQMKLLVFQAAAKEHVIYVNIQYHSLWFYGRRIQELVQEGVI